MTQRPLDIRQPTLALLKAYLELARPANVVTAWGDVLAGTAAALAASGMGPLFGWAPPSMAWLLLSTTGLYAGGVVLNDVCDADLDAVERPERPIPSGRASRDGALLFGVVLLTAGIGAAWQVSHTSGMIAAAIALAAAVYDRFSKHHALLGPLNMGLCRGGNLLLGASIVPLVVGSLWFLALIPITYIAAITAISRGEVHGGSRSIGWMAVAFVGLVTAALLALGLRPDYSVSRALLFAALFASLVMPAFLHAARQPQPESIRKAVRAGILGLIPLNATLAVGFAGWPYGIIVLALLPVSVGLARLFAVT